MMERWSGRVALVTGASAGIGAGITRMLVQSGMTVFGCARNIDKIQELQNEFTVAGFPGRMVAIRCDLRNEEDISAMFAQVEQEAGCVDVMVNNAGLAYPATILDGATEQWREMWEVNVLALSICTKLAVKSMQKKNVDDGHVIHLSSMSGHRLTAKDEHFYAATKQAVRVLTEALRAELTERKSHIRVTSISPGCVSTEFAQRMYQHESKESQAAAVCGFEQLEVSDIVDAVQYALGAAPRCQVHDILIRPTEQAK